MAGYSTIASVRFGARIGSVAISTLASFAQSIYNGDSGTDILINTLTSFISSSIIQGVGIKFDRVLPFLSNNTAISILNNLGTFDYGWKNLLFTFGKNLFKSVLSNTTKSLF